MGEGRKKKTSNASDITRANVASLFSPALFMTHLTPVMNSVYLKTAMCCTQGNSTGCTCTTVSTGTAGGWNA